MISKIQAVVLGAILLVCTLVFGEDTGDQLKVVGVTPSGDEVPVSRGEVIIEFNKKMVAFGQTDKDLSDVPVHIKPELQCTWRWTGPSQLTCTHSDLLTYSTSYVVSIGSSLKSLDGSSLTANVQFSFRTLSLGVNGRTSHWRSPTRPIFLVNFSQPMSLSTILEKVRIRNLETSELHEIKAVNLGDLYRWERITSAFYSKDEEGHWIRASESDQEEMLDSLLGSGINRRKYAIEERDFATRSWYLESKSSLNPGTTYDLEVEPNVRSIFATEPTTRSMHISRFEVYPSFEFLGIECIDTGGSFKQHVLKDTSRNEKTLTGCDPDEGITLLLTAPMEADSRTFESFLRPNPEHERYSIRSRFSAREQGAVARIYSWESNYGDFWTEDDLDKIKISYELRGNTTYELRFENVLLGDVFGRRLRSATDVKFHTGHLKPRLNFQGFWLVLSSRSNFKVPAEAANLKELRVKIATEPDSQSGWSVENKRQKLSLSPDRIVPTSLDLKSWLSGNKGRFSAAIEPIANPKFGNNPDVKCISGQVTPYNVHARIGSTSSIAWVTDLVTGQLVPDASVSLVETKDSSNIVLAEASTNEQGIALLPGKELFSPDETEKRWEDSFDRFTKPDCLNPLLSRHALRIEGPEGQAFLPLAYQLMTGGPSYSKSKHLSVWGHTAQGMYRPGELLQYKIFVRKQTDNGLQIDRKHRYRLVVTQGFKEVVHLENSIELSRFGAFHGAFTIPDSIRTDRNLSFRVMIDNGEPLTSVVDEESDSINYNDVEYWNAFNIAILDFDPATIRVESSLNKLEFENGDKLIVSGRSDLLSGGPFSNAPFYIEANLRSTKFVSEHPETKDYSFAQATGHHHRWNLEDFQIDSDSTDLEGGFSASLQLDVLDVRYGSLSVSLGVQEDSGNILWQDNRSNYRSTDRFVGIRQIGKQVRVGEPLSVDVVVVDSNGEPVNDRNVTVRYFLSERRGLAESSDNILVHTCEIAVKQNPKSCTAYPRQAGYYRAVATMEDTQGGFQWATQRIYVQGRVQRDRVEQSDYVKLANGREIRNRVFQVGEIASLVVEHSVPGAKALVTVERLGILDQWTTELSGSQDVIDIPIRRDYAPVVRASITVTTATSNIKPRNFFGPANKTTFPSSWNESVRLRIKDPAQLLNVQISTDKEIYKPGDKVRVSVAVTNHSSDSNPPLAELAVAVVDQGVLELSRTGINHFDPVRGLTENMDIDVESYRLLQTGRGIGFMASVGQPSSRNPRSDNDLVSLWLPEVQTNRSGTASFEFEIGERLTEWKIIVVATAATDQFGLGQQSVKTNLPIEIRPVLPNHVTDGDHFDASFSVLNRTESTREVTVKIETQGDVEPISHAESISLQPFERRIVSTKTLAKLENGQDRSDGKIQFLATALSRQDSDALTQYVPVHHGKPYFVSSIYGTSTKTLISAPIDIPSNVSDGTGYLEVQVTPSLISSIKDRIAQVRDYPYQCWEQRLSSAVVAAQFSRLRDRVGVDWHDATEYIEDVLKSAEKFQSEQSGGFGYWNGDSSNSDMYLSAYTALAFRWLSDAGFQVPVEVLEKLLEYLEQHTVYRLPDYLSMEESLVPSLRLMMANALVLHNRGDLDLVTKLYEESESSNLFSIAQTLEAAISLDAKDDFVAPLVSRLTNSIGVAGDRALIQHISVGTRNYMLSSQLKTTCSAISAFLGASNQGNELISQDKLAELVRGVLFEWNHQKFGANPHQSSFCLSALAEYADSMETVEDDFIVDVKLVLEGQSSLPQFVQSSEMNGSERSFVYSTPLIPDLIGTPGDLQLKQDGESRFYYKATLQYEPTEVQTERENFGIDLRRTYWIKSGDQWTELDDSHELRRGDVVHVGLYLDIRDQRDFVIIDDPVPGFLQPINVRLAQTNRRETQAPINDYSRLFPKDMEGEWSTLGSSRWGFYNRQIRNDSVRFSSDFLPSGRYRLYWSGRVISTGDFLARPAHAEAMYSPEVYGNSRPQRIAIAE